MGLKSFKDHVYIILDNENLFLPRCQKESDHHYIIFLPSIFFMKSKDFINPFSKSSLWLNTQVLMGKVSPRQKYCLLNFFRYEGLSERAIEFALYHEISHIWQFAADQLHFASSKNREIEADLKAAIHLQDIEGGHLFFFIFAIPLPLFRSKSNPPPRSGKGSST